MSVRAAGTIAAAAVAPRRRQRLPASSAPVLRSRRLRTGATMMTITTVAGVTMPPRRTIMVATAVLALTASMVAIAHTAGKAWESLQSAGGLAAGGFLYLPCWLRYPR